MPGHFDYPMHELPGLADAALQDRYHFTVNGPVDHGRLATHPVQGYRSVPIKPDPADLLDLRQD
jgi:hypothetical protein